MIETERLLLRPWRDEDRDPFWAMAQDVEVMKYLPADDRIDSDDAIDRMIAAQAQQGYCFWAMQHKADQRFIGFAACCPRVHRSPRWRSAGGLNAQPGVRVMRKKPRRPALTGLGVHWALRRSSRSRFPKMSGAAA